MSPDESDVTETAGMVAVFLGVHIAVEAFHSVKFISNLQMKSVLPEVIFALKTSTCFSYNKEFRFVGKLIKT